MLDCYIQAGRLCRFIDYFVDELVEEQASLNMTILNQIFKEMETIHDEANSTVSTTTTHFSQYMIVDSEKWFERWEDSFEKLREMWSGNTSYYKALNTILIVDCSWKMASVDPIDYRSIEIGYNGVTKDNYYDIVSDMDSPWDVEQAYLKYGRRKCSRASICENIINNMSSGDRIASIMMVVRCT